MYPKLFQACLLVLYDNGGVNRYAPEPATIELQAARFVCDRAEHGLATLSAADFERFVVGEATDAEYIARRSDELRVAHALLNEFFDGPASTDPA